MDLPPLTTLTNEISSNAASACRIVNDLYGNARRLLASENFDVHRVRFQHQLLIQTALPLLTAMEESAGDEGISDDWLQTVAQLFGELFGQLMEAEEKALGRSVGYLHPCFDDSFFSQRNVEHWTNTSGHDRTHWQAWKTAKED